MGERQADTAEQLMRSRYSAYAVGDGSYLWRSWHPRTRPDDVVVDAAIEWTGLEIVSTSNGGPSEDTGEVEFIAHYLDGGCPSVLHERSRFVVRAQRWFYLDGDLPAG